MFKESELECEQWFPEEVLVFNDVRERTVSGTVCAHVMSGVGPGTAVSD